MRCIPILALLTLSGAVAAAAQGIVLPVECPGGCAARVLVLDSVRVWANLDRGQAVTYVDHVIRNETADSVEGAFFFPLPDDARLDRVWVRFGFIPVPEVALPSALTGRPGVGLYAWRGGSALWTLREAAEG